MSKIETKIQEAKKKFKTGTEFASIDYPNWTRPNIQISDEVILKSNYPNLIWVKAKSPFGEEMWMPIYDSHKDQWAKINPKSK